jgi:hypothetical protein
MFRLESRDRGGGSIATSPAASSRGRVRPWCAPVRLASFDVCSIWKRGSIDCLRFVSTYRPPIRPERGASDRGTEPSPTKEIRPNPGARDRGARLGALLMRWGDRTVSLIWKGVPLLLGRSFRESASFDWLRFARSIAQADRIAPPPRFPTLVSSGGGKGDTHVELPKKRRTPRGPEPTSRPAPESRSGRGNRPQGSPSLEIIRN